MQWKWVKKSCYANNAKKNNRPWWPSGQRRHAIFQLIVATKGPGFKTLLRIMILIAQK